jgi:hypothetical protein
LVVAASVRVCVTVRPARAGETETVMLAGLTFSLRVTLFCWALESVTVKVTGTAAAVAVGVPEIAPAAVDVSPAGNVPAVSAQEIGA